MQPHNRCLSDFELGAYLDGRLSDSEREDLKRRLSQCTECREEVAAIGDIMRRKEAPVDDMMPEYLINKITSAYPGKGSLVDAVLVFMKETVDVIMSGPGIQVSEPLPIFGLRSARAVSPNMIIVTKSFDNIEVELDIERVMGDFCNIKAIVVDSGTKLLMSNLRVDLVSNNRELASDLLENGEVIFEDISSGTYGIRVMKNSRVLGELTIIIK